MFIGYLHFIFVKYLHSLMIPSVNKYKEQEEFPYTLVLSIINMKGCMLCNIAILLLEIQSKEIMQQKQTPHGWIRSLQIYVIRPGNNRTSQYLHNGTSTEYCTVIQTDNEDDLETRTKTHDNSKGKINATMVDWQCYRTAFFQQT